MSGARTLFAGVAGVALGVIAGYLAGSAGHRSAPEDARTPTPRTAKDRPPRAGSSTSAPGDRGRAAPPPSEPVAEPPADVPKGLRSEHDIEQILRSHLGHDPTVERIREVVVLRQALFDAQRRVPQDWEDEALRQVIRSVKKEGPVPLTSDTESFLRRFRSLPQPFHWPVVQGPRFAPLFDAAADAARVDLTSPPAKLDERAPVVLLLPEGVHRWDGRIAGTWTPRSDVTFQGSGMDTTLLQVPAGLPGNERGVTILRDLTLWLGETRLFKQVTRLRLERCRVLGWEADSRTGFLPGFEGLLYASDCRFEGGYGQAKEVAALLDPRGNSTVLARFERCRFRGPLELLRGWPPLDNRPRWRPTVAGTWFFDACTFLEMPFPTLKDLEEDSFEIRREARQGQDDGLKFLRCLADETVGTPPERRSLADLNPAWTEVR